MNINVGEHIYNKLAEILPESCYFELAPTKASFPYIVYTSGTEIPLEDLYVIIPVNIDIWDNKGSDISNLETITKNIFNAFNKYGFSNQDYSFNFNKGTIRSPNDPQPHIRRRQISYLMKYYEKK